MSNALNVIRNNSLMCQRLRSDLNDLNDLTKSKVEEVTSLKDNIQSLEAEVNSLTEELNSLKQVFLLLLSTMDLLLRKPQ